MARYTVEQLCDFYDALTNRIQGVPTNDQINTLTDTLNVQHTTVTDLIDALTARIKVLEDWRLAHMADEDAHS